MAGERIVVLYCGSSLTQPLFDKLLYLKTCPIMLPSDTSAVFIKELNPAGIIITGSPQYVHDPNAPRVDTAIYNLGIPILGICYGMQLIADDLGGSVKRMNEPEREDTQLKILTGANSILYQDFADAACFIWMVHICKVVKLPQNFICTSKTKITEYASMEWPAKRIYAVQYHPEHKGSQPGTSILWNFLRDVCGCDA
jgi:GMP synthase (glutamine-hydrolysing)